MKLQKEELAVVASHIHERIKEKNKVVASKEEIKLIAALLKGREAVNEKVKKLQDEYQQLQKDTFEKLGLAANFYIYSLTDASLKIEVEKTKTKKIPSLNDIRQAIIMKSLFSNETELKKFIEELVAKY